MSAKQVKKDALIVLGKEEVQELLKAGLPEAAMQLHHCMLSYVHGIEEGASLNLKKKIIESAALREEKS
jgi:hypothetical protein